MNLPNVTHGHEQRGIVRLSPDISEHHELSRRIADFLRSVGSAAITPTLATRSFKGFKAAQPGGRARLSASYSNERAGRFSAEISAFHHPSEINSHYNLSPSGSNWLKVDTSRGGRQQVHSVETNDDMLHDMLEYAPADGYVAELLDRRLTAQAIAKAVYNDMARKSAYRAGSDHYKATVPTFGPDGYVSTRHIELIDTHVNRAITRQLSVTALTTLGSGPVDIKEQLVYEASYDRAGHIKEDEARLVLTSSDGLSPQALTNYAVTSDVSMRRFDVLYDAFNELSRSVFLDDMAD